MSCKPQDLVAENNNTADQEFLRNLKIRNIEQKFLYLSNGATRFYNMLGNPSHYNLDWSEDEIFDSLSKHISKEERVCFISLGCGSAYWDKATMRKVQEKGYNFHFLGVDSSQKMIQLAEESFAEDTFSHEFWVMDLTAYEFSQKIGELGQKFDKLFFILVGGTISNMVQTEISDTLFNVMKPGDLLWFECVLRKANSKLDDLEQFKHYSKRLTSPEWVKFIYYPLENIGVPMSSGLISVENIQEESAGALVFRYSFCFHHPVTVKYLDEYIHFIPPERIKLLDIRVYHKKTFVKFLEQHDLKLLSFRSKESLGEFIFTRV